MKLKNYYLVCLLMLFGSIFEGKAQSWADISTTLIKNQGIEQGSVVYQPGCGNVVVNRLTGEAAISITDFGMWKILDQGIERIDQNTISNRCACAWSIQCDQNDPKRMVVFSIDGNSAYTNDGINWKSIPRQHRGWDLGAVNWDSEDPKVIFAAQHEHNDNLIQLSNDGGITWKELDIKMSMQSNSSSGRMLGVIDSLTFIYSNNNGINRSTDQGETWTNVVPSASVTTRSKLAVMFDGVCYVGTTKGLLVSKDKGETWETQGSSIDVIQGPQFGEDKNTMVIVNTTGMYKSKDAGTTWRLISALHTRAHQYPINDVFWFGRYVWDPVNNACYATSIGNPAFKKELGPIDIIAPTAPTEVTAINITSTGFTVTWKAATDNIRVTDYEVFNGGESCGTTTSGAIKLTGLTAETTYAITVKALDAEGNASPASEAINVTTLPPPDTQAPTIPENLQASEITDTSFKLSWSPSTDNVGVVGYKVYKNGVEYGSTEDTYMTISALNPDALYTMIVRAVDAAGNQSAFSAGLPVNTTIDIDNTAANEVAIYPNPANDYITIEVPNIFGSITIYNAAGVAVAEKRIETNTIKMDVSAYPKGAYLAKIISGNKCVTKSFIVE